MHKKYSTQSLKVQFENSSGFKLDGRLDQPTDIEPIAYVIMCHCFTCTKETLTTSRVSRGLAQKGLGVLRFDFTGLGDSEGSFADSNFTSMVNDVLSASHYLKDHYHPPVALIGHSMGGTAILAAATEINSCHSVITIASPSQPQHVLHHFGPAMKQLEAGEDTYIVVANEQYPVKPQFISDIRQYNLKKTLENFSKRLLSIRAGNDELVAKNDADEIIRYTHAEHKLLDFNEADHLFRDREISNTMISEIADWIIDD
jgi:alpha/beta superfamily hydrolase